MGGFFFTRLVGHGGGEKGDLRRDRALKSFAERGLPLRRSIVSESFTVDVFNKARAPAGNVVVVDGSDFVVGTGTLFYKGLFGDEALRNLYADFSGTSEVFRDLVGQFSVLLRKNGRLWLFNDLAGTHHIFGSRDGDVVSSSFLAVAKSVNAKTVDLQGLWEYLADGATYGDSTFVEEVFRFDGDEMHVLAPDRVSVRKEGPYRPLDSGLPIEDQVEQVHEGLMKYTRLIASYFGDEMAIALSGGYDSRHLVGLLRAAGVRPYLYVYGPPTSPDVRLSKLIAAGEHLEVNHLDKSTMPVVDPHKYPEIVRQQFYLHDGMGGFGSFGNGGDVHSRGLRTKTASLQINGSCGEAYRNIFALPDRPFSIGDFVRARHDWADWSLFSDRFNREQYFETIEAKILKEISVRGPILTRREVDRIYPKVRARYRVGPCVSVNNTDTWAVGPFLEASMLVPTEGIPYGRKDLGRFHAALIRRAAPALARYPSVYGHSFEGRIPLWVRIRNSATVNSVYLPKALTRRLKTRRRTPPEMPWYLRPRHLGEVLDLDSLEVSRFIHIGRIRNPSLLSRALTVELVLRNRF